MAALRRERNTLYSKHAGKGEKTARWAVFEGKPTSGVSPKRLPHLYFTQYTHSDFSFEKSEVGCSRNKAEKLFFLQKVFLFAIFPRKIANSLFKNAPFRLGVPLSAESGQGLCAPEPAPKGLSPFGIRSSRESNCKF